MKGNNLRLNRKGKAGNEILRKLMWLIVQFEVFTPVVMKNSVFWDIMPRSPSEIIRLLGGTCRPHLQGRRISEALLDTCFMLVTFLAYSWTQKMEATLP
jgi:hypothetical protein